MYFQMCIRDRDQIDYDRILEMYKDRYKDASDFTFYLVGNVTVSYTHLAIEW